MGSLFNVIPGLVRTRTYLLLISAEPGGGCESACAHTITHALLLPKCSALRLRCRPLLGLKAPTSEGLLLGHRGVGPREGGRPLRGLLAKRLLLRRPAKGRLLLRGPAEARLSLVRL